MSDSGCYPQLPGDATYPRRRQTSQVSSPIAEAETGASKSVAVLGQDFGTREPASLAGLRFVPKLIEPIS